MSEHYSIDHLAHKVGPFDIRVGYFYEDIHPSDLFDNSTNPDTGKPYYDTDEMAKRIDANIDASVINGSNHQFVFYCSGGQYSDSYGSLYRVASYNSAIGLA